MREKQLIFLPVYCCTDPSFAWSDYLVKNEFIDSVDQGNWSLSIKL